MNEHAGTTRRRVPPGQAAAGSTGATVSPRPPRGAVFPIVGVGASAGGLDAFTQLLKHLPSDTGMAFILIQHLDPTHPSFLREALSKATTMPVTQPLDGTPVERNHVYVIPPDADITVRRGRLSLSPRTLSGHGQHLPVDVCFSSIAAEGGSRAIGVVLSGNASDGTEGLRAIKAAGGITFTQDRKSAKFPEMPQSAIAAGVVDHSLPIPKLALELARLSLHPYVAAPEPPLSAGDAAALAEILVVVREALGVDFTQYKSPTFERRLARRMALRRVDGRAEYLSLLRTDPNEVRSLYEEVLIHVTSFFRDREAFEVVASKVLPAILKNKPAGAPVRFWVPGCSSGEEVYSLAILLLEALRDSTRPIQIFGSDVSEAIIAKARAGVYSEAALRDVSDERRKRYFIKTDSGYRINKVVRDLCVFVQHDLARDPPFAKLDLVSCRNVLIYFQQELQKRLMATFHYALCQPGFLLLGRTESISSFDHLFSPVDKSHKIFMRKGGQSALRFAPRLEARPTERHAVTHDGSEPAQRAPDVAKQVDRLLLARYAPPGVVINQRMQVLSFRGQTGTFLEPAPGAPQSNLISMARPGLLSALRPAIAQAAQDMAPVRTSGVNVDHAGGTTTCDVVVVPLAGLPELKEPLFVVLFEETHPATREAAHAAHGQPVRAASDGAPLRKVEHELAATKEYLRSLIEEHGRTNDDLGSANEELVSGNEELQSMNEELETAKEELQATNEELTTVNDELQDRNREASQSNSDLVNLLATVEIPILIVDLERRIRRLTPKATSILNVLPTDLGRPVDDIKPNINVADMDGQIAAVIETMAMKESEVQDREGHWYRMQIRPYKTTDNRIDGAILSLVDIDALKHHVDQAQQGRVEAEGANQAKDLFLAILGHELRTPLASLLLQAQRLRRAPVTDAAKLTQIGDAVERATRTQMQLIDDLLDVSRIVAGKLKIEMKATDLREVVNAAVEGVIGQVERKSIALKVEMDETVGNVLGDPVRLQQVVSNLLTNAVKFTPERGQVTVTLTATSGRARLEVIDTGMGIEPAFLPDVFNRFSQEDTTNTRRHGGLGLGLAIVRHLVEQHGGTVRADSLGSGKGATFSVMLPLMHVTKSAAGGAGPAAIEAGSEAAHAGDDDERIKGLRILLVDDDVGTREAVAGILGEMGAKVKVAESAAEAMNAFAELKPQVLVCDVAMPGEDGYSFIRRLRSLGPEAGGGVPAVALTAFATEDDQRRSLSAGFQMHLTKPVASDRLAAAIVDLAGLTPHVDPRR